MIKPKKNLKLLGSCTMKIYQHKKTKKIVFKLSDKMFTALKKLPVDASLSLWSTNKFNRAEAFEWE